MHCMQFLRVLENITFCNLFTNRLRPFCNFNNHTVASNNRPFLFSSETWDAALLSLAVGVSCLQWVLSLSLTVLNTATLQTRLLRKCTPLFDRVTSLFGTIYSVFSLIRPNIRCIFCYLNVCTVIHRHNDVWLKRPCCSFCTSSSMNADLNVFNSCFTL